MYVTAQTDVYLNGTVWGDQICHVTHRIGDVCTGQEMCIMSHLSANVTVGYVRHDAQTCDVFIYVTYSHMWPYSFIYVTLLWEYVTSLILDSCVCGPWLKDVCAMSECYACRAEYGHVRKGSFHLHLDLGDARLTYLYCRCKSCASSFLDACDMTHRTHLYVSQFTDILLCAQYDYLIRVSRLLQWPLRQFDSTL